MYVFSRVVPRNLPIGAIVCWVNVVPDSQISSSSVGDVYWFIIFVRNVFSVVYLRSDLARYPQLHKVYSNHQGPSHVPEGIYLVILKNHGGKSHHQPRPFTWDSKSSWIVAAQKIVRGEA